MLVIVFVIFIINSSSNNKNINIIETVAHIKKNIPIFTYFDSRNIRVASSFILLANIPLALENLDNINYQLTSLLTTGLIQSLKFIFLTKKDKYLTII